jgi:hypothetical protein
MTPQAMSAAILASTATVAAGWRARWLSSVPFLFVWSKIKVNALLLRLSGRSSHHQP